MSALVTLRISSSYSVVVIV